MNRREFVQSMSIAAIFPIDVRLYLPKPEPSYLLRIEPPNKRPTELMIQVRIENVEMLKAAIQANAEAVKELIAKHIKIVAKHKGPINE